ncbi:MAG: YceG family protein [Clostridium sp.]|uniref:YceG family protein n=1 Tax=Clostridium sp. TaxID=1506 RepID=UPI003EE51BCC
MKLKSIIGYMFRKKYERDYENPSFKPYFYRFIGVDNVNEYDNELKTIQSKCDEIKNEAIIFDGTIPLTGEMELIQYIYSELNNMDIFNMVSQDITIFNDSNDNFKFLSALDYVIKIAVNKEGFFNNSVRNNFITKLIVWVFTYIKDMELNGDQIPKCIYYGKIDRHEIYFLMLVNKMGFDTIYINPLKEEGFEGIEEESILVEEKAILSIETFDERCKRGKVIENHETLTKMLQREVQDELFTGTGMYKPWQFRDGYTRSISLDTILEDIYVYFDEPAKLRSGFSVKGDTVNVPTIFFKIDGVYDDMHEYQRLLKKCVSSNNTLVLSNNKEIINDIGAQNDIYSVMFCQLSDGTFDIEEIKKLPFYKFAKYSNEVQNFMLKKFNEAILSNDVFNNDFTKEEVLQFLVLILGLSDEVIRMIDNFDYTGQIPKIVVFIDKEESISVQLQLVLGYLHIVGMDIVIFNPSGLFNINYILKKDIINIERLETMKYDIEYSKVINLKQKQGMFSRFLGM